MRYPWGIPMPRFCRWLFLLLLACTGLLPACAREAAEPAARVDGLPVIQIAQLPPEAVTTLKLIRQGGPFPYERDGIVFGNFERILPKQRRGYYHEYTVPTPGARNRGARRIVSGQGGEFYYTDDHYQSFKRIID